MLTDISTPGPVQHKIFSPTQLLKTAKNFRRKKPWLGFGQMPSTFLPIPTNIRYVRGVFLRRMREVAVVSSSLGPRVFNEAVNAEGEVEIDSAVFKAVFPSVERVANRAPVPSLRTLPSPQSKLIPDDWKQAQQYLHRTKKERKQGRLDLQLEFARQRKAEVRITQREGAVQKAEAEIKDTENEQRFLRGQGFSLVDDWASGESVEQWEEEEEGMGDMEAGLREQDMVVSGRAIPKDYRREFEFSSLDDIAASLREEGGLFEEVGTEQSSENDAEEDSRPQEKPENFSWTPEEKAMLKNKNVNLAKISSCAWSPLHTLAASGQVYLAAELLKKGAAVDEVDHDGLTPLHRAVQSGQKTTLRMLLKAGANPQVLDRVGATLAHYCAQVGSDDLTKLVLRHGVDVNRADNDGWTPLHVAVQSGRLELIKTLVKRGADVRLANKDGNTALDLSLAFSGCFNFYDAVKLLKKWSVLDSGDSVSN